jgi:hypothetical protein
MADGPEEGEIQESPSKKARLDVIRGGEEVIGMLDY